MQRRALVTGANRGIGLAVVRALADLGMDVVLASRDHGAGLRAAASLPFPVRVIRLDVADAASVRKALDAAGPIDVLVNNAAIKPASDAGQAEVDAAWNTNYLGAARVLRGVVAGMQERGWGRIVNASSELASRAHGPRRGGAYDITKIALNALTRAVAEELHGTGILVNACSPGWCRSDMGGGTAPRSVEQGARSLVWGVTLPDGGPTGGFYQDGAPLPW